MNDCYAYYNSTNGQKVNLTAYSLFKIAAGPRKIQAAKNRPCEAAFCVTFSVLFRYGISFHQ